MLGIKVKIIQNLILQPKGDKTVYEVEEHFRWEWEKPMTIARHLLQAAYMVKDIC